MTSREGEEQLSLIIKDGQWAESEGRKKEQKWGGEKKTERQNK